MSLSQQPLVPNSAYVIGQPADWNQPDSPPVGPPSTWVLHEFYGTMYLNRSNRRYKDGSYRSGGSWLAIKTVTERTPSAHVVVWRSDGPRIAYRGSFVGSTVLSPVVIGTPTDRAAAEAHYNASFNRGAEAWNRMRPDLPDFSMATSILELKDYVPLLKQTVKDIILKMADLPPTKRSKRRSSELSRAGQHYLAAQFGWLSVVRDLTKFIVVLSYRDKKLRQLIRDNERPIRRSRRLSDNNSYVKRSTNNLGLQSTPHRPTMVTQCYTVRNGIEENLITRDWSQWCEGSFSYMLPKGPRDLKWRNKIERRIMGGIVTPREVYELVPWSWLADYFTDIGNFVSAISGGVSDRLYCQYAYIMRTTHQVATTVATDGVKTGPGGSETIITTTNKREYTIKSRVKASPFGFGFAPGNLSLRQTAILGALGLSKLP